MLDCDEAEGSVANARQPEILGSSQWRLSKSNSMGSCGGVLGSSCGDDGITKGANFHTHVGFRG